MLLTSAPKGTTSQSVLMRFANQISFVPSISMGFSTSGLELSYMRVGSYGGQSVGPISFAAVSLVGVSSAYNSGGITQLLNGWARVDVPDAAFAKAVGVNGVLITGSATGIVCTEPVFVTLVDGVNSPFASTPQVY